MNIYDNECFGASFTARVFTSKENIHPKPRLALFIANWYIVLSNFSHKPLRVMTSLFSLLILIVVIPLSAQTTGTIIVHMHGMKNDNGLMRVALFSPQDRFPSDKPFRGQTTTILKGEAECVFEHVPFGEYAVSAFHDENANQKLDLGLFGPVEAYGFSNGARSFLPPPFERAKIVFREEKMVAKIEIK